MDSSKTTDAQTLKNTAIALVSGAGGSGANRFVSSQSPMLRSLIAQVLMSVVGIGGGLVFLKNKRTLGYEILKGFMLGLGFESVSALVSYAGAEISAAQQAQIAQGVSVSPAWEPLIQATSPVQVEGLAGYTDRGSFLQKVAAPADMRQVTNDPVLIGEGAGSSSGGGFKSA